MTTSEQPATLCPPKKKKKKNTSPLPATGAGAVPPLTLMASLSIFLGGFPALGAISQTFHERVERLSLQLSLPSKKGRHAVIVNPSYPVNTANGADFHRYTKGLKEMLGCKLYQVYGTRQHFEKNIMCIYSSAVNPCRVACQVCGPNYIQGCTTVLGEK